MNASNAGMKPEPKRERVDLNRERQGGAQLAPGGLTASRQPSHDPQLKKGNRENDK
jgi:hypothetical protein